MYIIEINEDRFENILEYMNKSAKCINKALECMNSLRNEEYESENGYDEEPYSERERYSNHRGVRSGRYRRY